MRGGGKCSTARTPHQTFKETCSKKKGSELEKTENELIKKRRPWTEDDKRKTVARQTRPDFIGVITSLVTDQCHESR